MDGETNGGQEATQGAQDQAQQQGQEQQETQQQGQSQVETPDYERQIAERDETRSSSKTVFFPPDSASTASFISSKFAMI